jgi:hypothetical protein
MIIRTPPKITNRNAILKYIEVDLWSWMKDLTIELFKVNFLQNFQSFNITDLSIPANTEVSIPNGFASSYPGLIPSARIITRQQGDANILDGVNEWTPTHVYLRNPSANDAVISVTFLK